MTDWSRIEQLMNEVAPGFVRENLLLAPFTSYNIGGASRLIVEPDSEQMVGDVLKVLAKEKVKPFILGGGSNVLISDDGWDGVTLHIGSNLSGWEFAGNDANVKAGSSLLEFICGAVKHGLGGMESMAGIPGEVGGALRMNAGAFGQEIESTVKEVRGFTINGEQVAFGRDAIDFGYRSAPELQDIIITSAHFEFKPSDADVLNARMDDVLAMRLEKQPLEYPSCGSVFKRPPGNYAGALIEEVGLKGMVHGSAQVSVKHAGFIVNIGGAKALDVRELIQIITDKVKDRFGVELQREVKFVGFDDVRE